MADGPDRLVVVCGSRVADRADVAVAMDVAPWRPQVILQGNAPGADRYSMEWALDHNIEVHEYVADWGSHGRRAGPIRNAQMAADCTAVIAVWDGRSRGTADMISQAVRAGKPVFVWPLAGGDR